MKHYVILLLAMCDFAIADATLTDDIDDFVDLFPADSTIPDIILSYMKSDEKIKAAIEHIQSLGLESKLESLTNLPEFEAVENFVKDAGLEPSVAINAMSRILGMSNLAIARSTPEKSSEVIISGGFEGFFGDILAAFPAESIAALREKKLISSPVFSTFVEKITSQEFQGHLTALQATDEYQELFKLLSPRVNLFDFVNLFASAIGLGSDGVAYNVPADPTTSFHESMNDFIELSSSSDDVVELGEEYYKAGSKIPDIIRSLKSDEFTGLFDALKNTEEYLALEKSFQETGLDLKSMYRKLYQTFVQLALLNDAYSDADTNVGIIEGLREFLEDYRNKKAAKEIADLHREKRAAADALVERTKSDDLIALHDALTAKERFPKIKEALLSIKASEKNYASLFSKLINIYTKPTD